MIRCSLLAATAFTAVALATAPDISKINGTIDVMAGQPYGEVSTINGAIHIEDQAIVGRAHTVNGAVTLGAGASAQSVSTVNGSISVGAGAHVTGIVKTVNGRIVLEPAAEVFGHLSNVNGLIRLDAAHAGAGIETVSGNIEIGGRSRVEGGIQVRSSCSTEFWAWLLGSHCEPSLIVIGPDTVVQGTLRFEHEVKLYVSARARIGPVEGAKAIVYAGERPPG
jgi:DUF4097 and DUF4098 domain-containing protein YvlB